ncbi:MAG: DUF2490 domain-containing protein [Myxococcaceae bacterium]|nr:DUF2490 domain-containing protein [Myxococcaceae bacterium]
MRTFLALVCLVSSVASAQEAAAPPAPIEHDLQSWTLLTAWGRKERFRWYAEAQPRVGLTTGRFERLLVRPAVGLQVTPEVSLWLGYAWTPTFGPYRDEQRPFQQVLVEQRLAGIVTLINRFRVEERFIADTGGASIRLRHMVRAVVRFGASSAWGVAASEELFVTLNQVDRGPAAGFDQNRAFLGLNVKVDAWQFELGYMNVYVERAGPAAERMLHTITGMVIVNVP